MCVCMWVCVGRCEIVCVCRDFDRSLFHIALLTKDEPSRLIVKWQIDHIRQYGSNSTAFKFQSGGSVHSQAHTHPNHINCSDSWLFMHWVGLYSNTVCTTFLQLRTISALSLTHSLPLSLSLLLCSKSPTGVGWFIVETESGAALRIHKAVDYWAKYIVDQIRSQPRGEMVSPPLSHREIETPSLSVCLLSSQQRAGSVPTPQPAPHPPLSASLGAEQPTGNYTPLTIATLDGQGVYQPVAAPGPQGGRQPVTPAKNISKGGRGEEGGVYQALGQKDAPSNYAVRQPLIN